jgi:hypothetical protein
MRRIVNAHAVHLANYSVATGKDVGRVLNVAEEESGVKQKVWSLE